MTTDEKPVAPYSLRVLCHDSNAAQLFETWLLSEGIDTSGTDGRDVLIPWSGDARSAIAVGEAATQQGFAPDDLRPITRQIFLVSTSSV